MTDAAPIILIGAARSGTKFLRDVLASAVGVKSVPYDVNYIWRHGSPNYGHDVLDPDTLTAKRSAYISESLFKLAKLGEKDTLVEKTVSNSLRVKFVNKVFPNARFVHIIRDGRDVAESAMRQWRAKPDLPALLRKLGGVPLGSREYVYWFARNFVSGLAKGRGGGKVWGPRFPGISFAVENLSLAEVCALQWRESVHSAQFELSDVPNSEDRVFTIRYEDLVKDELALNKLLEDLHLPDKDNVLRSYRVKRRPSVPEQWKLLPEVDQLMISRIVETLDITGNSV